MKYENWLKLKDKLRKETDKLIEESEIVYTKGLLSDDEIVKYKNKTTSAHIDEIVNRLEEAINYIDYFTDLQ